MWRHGYTYSGTCHGCRSGKRQPRHHGTRGSGTGGGRDWRPSLATGLTPLSNHHLVSEVRAGVGALAAVQLSSEAVDEDPGLPNRLVGALREHGILTRMLFGDAVQVSPPLTLDDAGVKELADGIRGALDAVG